MHTIEYTPFSRPPFSPRPTSLPALPALPSPITPPTIRLEKLRKKLGWPEKGIDNYMRDQGIDSGTSRAKGYLSELGWRQGETQSYGEEDEF